MWKTFTYFRYLVWKVETYKPRTRDQLLPSVEAHSRGRRKGGYQCPGMPKEQVFDAPWEGLWT